MVSTTDLLLDTKLTSHESREMDQFWSIIGVLRVHGRVDFQSFHDRRVNR